MKKWVVYLLGILTGVVLTIAGIMLFAYINNATSNEGITYFEEPGKIAEDKDFRVFQVLDDNAALVNARSDELFDSYHGKVYLIVNDEGEYYYDEQKITAPAGKVFRQVGIYRYPTKNEDIKTVPVIMLLDK